MQHRAYLTCPVAHLSAMDALFEILGQGPESFSGAARLVAVADPDGPVTHHGTNTSGLGPVGEQHVRALMVENQLPPLPEGEAWGENGIVSAAAVQAAGAALTLDTATAPSFADVNLNEWGLTCLAKYGLQTEPPADI